MLTKVSNLAKAMLTIGSVEQSFIGAKWLELLLRLVPTPLKRQAALRILALSPHYFYRHLQTGAQPLSTTEWLELELARNQRTRQTICSQLLSTYLESHYRVLDIGCGPGFLAQAVSAHVANVFACDISRGVLACARILNGADNIRYINSESSLDEVADASIDVVYSIAVIQHLRQAVIDRVFREAHRKLRPGGKALFHVQLQDARWTPEEAWEEDSSVYGRLRLKYALNCFPRSEAFFRSLGKAVGLSVLGVYPLKALLETPFDDIYYQHVIVLEKPPRS